MENQQEPPSAEQLFGVVMKRYREARRMSQQAFAEKMCDKGFSWQQSTTAKTEAGERPLRVNEAAAIGDILSTPIVTFLRDYDDAVSIALRNVLESETRLARLQQQKDAAATELRNRQRDVQFAKQDHTKLIEHLREVSPESVADGGA